MSAATEDPGSREPTTGSRERPRPSKRDQLRTVGLLILAVLITLFAVLNTGKVKVNWIVGSGHAPLIIVIVVSLLVGIILTYFADRRAARRR